MVMAQELVGLAEDSSQTSNAQLHKVYRRLFSIALSPRAVQSYGSHQVQQFRQVALDILASPESYVGSIKRAVSAIAYRVAYGYNIKDENDPMLVRADKAMRILEQILRPANFLVDVLPILKYVPEWMPGAGFKRIAKEYKAHYEETRETPFHMVERDIAAGTATPSFVATLLEEQDASEGGGQYEKERIMWSAASIHSAGSDTSAAAIQNWIASAVLFRHTQTLAQAELDRVIGRSRPPTLADRERLPYCWAVVMEVLRWEPVAPFALLHKMGRQEVYDGYVLPKGPIVMANVWAMSRDERDYPSPQDFRPERYLTSSTRDNKDIAPDSDASAWSPAGKGTFGFGFGRRVCPGQHLAEATIFAAVVTMLWALKLELKEGAKVEWPTEAAVNRPNAFAIVAKERFEGVREILMGASGE